MSRSAKTDDFTADDLKEFGVFAPLASFMREINNNLSNISAHLYNIDDALTSINSKIKHPRACQEDDSDYEHQ